MTNENISLLVDQAVELQEEIAARSAALESVKAKIQQQLYSKMQDRNISYSYADGEKGRAELQIRTRLNITDFESLAKILGSSATENIKVTNKPKYDIAVKYRNALTALLTLDYDQTDLEHVLTALGATSEARKVLVKKLKGDYRKDLKLLAAAGLGAGDLEEELDAIRASKNAELVRGFFDLDTLDCGALARAVAVENSLALTISPDEA